MKASKFLWLLITIVLISCSVYRPKRCENIEDYALKLIISNVETLQNSNHGEETIYYKYVHLDTAQIHRYAWLNRWVHDSLFQNKVYPAQNIYYFTNKPLRELPKYYKLLEGPKSQDSLLLKQGDMIVRIVGSYVMDIGTLVHINQERFESENGVECFILFDKNRKYLRSVMIGYNR